MNTKLLSGKFVCGSEHGHVYSEFIFWQLNILQTLVCYFKERLNLNYLDHHPYPKEDFPEFLANQIIN